MEKVLEFLKKAEFNSFMIALAIGATAFYFKIDTHPYNEIAFFTAIVASSYCIIRLVVFCFNKIKKKNELKKEEEKKELARKRREEQEQKFLSIEISRMFDGLTKDDKEILAFVINNGKKDKYNINVFHYSRDNYHLTNLINQVDAMCRIYRQDNRRVYDPFDGQSCIKISYYTGTITLTIEQHLLELIKQYNQE
ncbi:MAG: hypothetical protein J6T88_08250 [Bacteroidales bacterium]|nr:hypothetical protein [Bacteroidales bacterium]